MLDSVMSLTTLPFLTWIPAFLLPNACKFLSSVTTLIGLSPAFSARVKGIISKASANAFTQHYSAPDNSLEYFASFYDNSISIEPPPGMIPLFLTKHLTTQRAS